MFALESAMDELAVALRPRPGRAAHPQRARRRPRDRTAVQQPQPRRVPARRAPSGSAGPARDPRPAHAPRGALAGRHRRRRVDLPGPPAPGRQAASRVRRPTARYTVEIDAADIGTGAWTALTQIAADALGVPLDASSCEIGDSRLPQAPVRRRLDGHWRRGAGRSCSRPRELRGRLDEEYGGAVPADGVDVDGGIDGESRTPRRYSMHAFGAQFAEVRVDADTGEVRVPRATRRVRRRADRQRRRPRARSSSAA